MGDQSVILCGLVIVALLVILAVIRFAMWLQWFSRELRYLNKEIARTTGEEQASWKRKKRQLWLSWIPFIGA